MWRLLQGINSSIAGVLGRPGPALVLVIAAAYVLSLAPLTNNGLGGNPSSTGSERTTPKSPQPQVTDQEATPEALATRIIYAALYESVWGEPAWCQVRQQIRIHGKQSNCFGKFVRAGKGSGKLNLSLQIASGESINSILQVSDGQRLQSIEEFGGERKRTIVDLDEVRDDLRSRLVMNTESIRDPIIALYLAIGGQAESLRQLCQQYSWYSVHDGKFADQPVWILQGRKNSEPPKLAAHARIDANRFLESRSGLMPTEVQVAIGKPADGSQGQGEAQNDLPFWLYQVTFKRGAHETTALNSTPEMRLVTEWVKPQRLEEEQLSDEHFQVVSTNDPWSEETLLYLPPSS